MKQIPGFCLSALLSLTLTGSLQAEDPLRVGAVIPLTGPTSVVGKDVHDGLELCAGPRERFFFEDSQAQPAVGVAAFNKLVRADRIDLGIVAFSGVSSAVIPIAAAARIPLILTVVSARTVGRTGTGEVFRFFTSGEQEGPVMARYLAGPGGCKSAAVLYLEDEYGLAYQKAFSAAFSAGGGKLLASESFGRESTDYRTQLTRLRALAPDALYIIGHDAHILAGLRQARELGLRAKLVSNWLLSSPSVRAGQEALVEGALFTAPEFNFSSNAAVLDFKKTYQRRYGREATAYAALGCDTARMIAEFGAKGPAALVEALRGIRHYPALLGELNAAADGSIEFELHPATLERGQVRKLEAR